jgi:iron complex transport system ATP-binding protein
LLRADSVSFAYQRQPAGRAGWFGSKGGASGSPQHGPGREVISGVSAELHRGQILGILGPNGSGKTTLLRLLCGTRVPSSGDVSLDGVPLRQMSRRAIAQRIAVVPQETHLAFEYTVLEMVLMGRHPHLGVLQLEGPHDVEVAREALAATGTGEFEARLFTTLSGGEKQRVVIASALAQASDILLLDEPTASLDLGYQLEIATLLQQLNRQRGVTIALSTHDLNLAAAICDALVLIRDGHVLAAGETHDVLTPENVRALYDVSVDVHRHSTSGRIVVVPLARVDARP